MIDAKTKQRALGEMGLYAGKIDGIIGKGTIGGMRAALLKPQVAGVLKGDPDLWSASRIELAFEQMMMWQEGIDVGEIDGVEGVLTQYGREQWQNRIRGAAGTVPPFAARPPAHADPDARWPFERDAERFYGRPGTGHTRIVPAYQLYYGDQPVKSVLIHEKCAESLSRIFKAVLAHYGAAKIKGMGLDVYGGSFNDRAMRGGTRKSMHAYACAIDMNPAKNPLRGNHRTALFAKPEYAAFVDAFEAEGWISLGRERDFDWMHFQAARL